MKKTFLTAIAGCALMLFSCGDSESTEQMEADLNELKTEMQAIEEMDEMGEEIESETAALDAEAAEL